MVRDMRFGMAALPMGVALAAIEIQQPAVARAVPIAVAVVVLIAGALQLTAWKTRHCPAAARPPGVPVRWPPTPARPVDTACASASTAATAVPMAILLVIGVMDFRAMAVVAAAITVERLAPAGERVARVTGAVVERPNSHRIDGPQLRSIFRKTVSDPPLV
jgi:predicted metal-binding membrane protein